MQTSCSNIDESCAFLLHLAFFIVKVFQVTPKKFSGRGSWLSAQLEGSTDCLLTP
jgi:hypothetical protein